MPRRVHVIGAGLAGLSAAVQLQRRGAQVVLHEAGSQAGGRCRTYYDRALGATIDSGNHLMLSGNSATLNFTRIIGSGDELTGPDQAVYPFVDLATNARWTIKLSPGRFPWWIFDASVRVPNTLPTDYLALAPLPFAKTGRTVAETMRCNGPVWDRLLRPFLLALVNVEPRDATAELIAAVFRDTLSMGGQACRPLVARNGLSSAFIDPALRLLQHGGAVIRLESPLKQLEFADNGRVAALHAGDERIVLEPGEAVVLAVPGDVAQTLVPGLTAPNRSTTTVSAHFAIDPPMVLPTVTGLLNGTADWLFSFDGRLSATVGAAERLIDTPRETLAKTIWADVAKAANLPVEPMPSWQIEIDRHAGFAAVPDQEMRRPGTRTRWNNLMLAGDWTATGLPATIEGAIRSGQKAVDALLNEPMER
ncbi:hydroxysqualene dehydroxylase HpnE [Paraburkholderia sp.]|uniref:hydroxysqualene dehydroxylase HpnE n=1 Tax=Paraburkholderia sp. TaxID=1926495 RepID=UPI0023A0B64C|nr:hydroxysqualene dehydroxylase HpnE [Paraburkholderia sp.]MDE1180261.1 hydroxysqualene dehydroxylase HpnE [Paraburkholderia sp.]